MSGDGRIWGLMLATALLAVGSAPYVQAQRTRTGSGHYEMHQAAPRQERPRAEPKQRYENPGRTERRRYESAPAPRAYDRPDRRYESRPERRYESRPEPRYIPQPEIRPVPRRLDSVPRPGHSGNWLKEYRNVPRDQRERALESDPQFQKLPPQRQQQLRQRLDRFSSLPPQQQDRILNRMETWEHLTPQQKQTARGLYQQMQKLPPGRRDMVEGAIRDLRQLPPEQRQEMLNSPRYRNMFTSGERDMLNGITQLPLAPANAGDDESR